MKIFSICNDTCESNPFLIRLSSYLDNSYIIISDDGKEVDRIPFTLQKYITSFENYTKIISSSTAGEINLSKPYQFLAFSIKYPNNIPLELRNIKFIKSSSVSKVNDSLYRTPNEEVIFTLDSTFLKTYSYQPSIILPHFYDLNETVDVTCLDEFSNVIPISFSTIDEPITFNEQLTPNGIYILVAQYTDGSTGNSIIKEYRLKVVKKKLKTYDFITANMNEEGIYASNKIDVDNDLAVTFKADPSININNVSASINTTHRVVKKEQAPDGTVTVYFEIIGLLESNTDYKVTASYIDENGELITLEKIITTNLFHSCVEKISIGNFYLQEFNEQVSNDILYILNENNFNIQVFCIVGYADNSIELTETC